MDRLVVKSRYGSYEPPYILCYQCEEDDWNKECREKLYNFEEEAEQKERGCEYCREYEDLPEHYINGNFVGRVFDTSIDKDENGWHIELPSGADIGIRYCPFCGRELI